MNNYDDDDTCEECGYDPCKCCDHCDEYPCECEDEDEETISFRHTKCGDAEWTLDGLLHRDNGPAFISQDGQVQSWHQHGRFHREGGPAKDEYGDKYWYVQGKLHRTDGPAIECSNGYKEWWLNDSRITEEEFILRTSKKDELQQSNLSKKEKQDKIKETPKKETKKMTSPKKTTKESIVRATEMAIGSSVSEQICKALTSALIKAGYKPKTLKSPIVVLAIQIAAPALAKELAPKYIPGRKGEIIAKYSEAAFEFQTASAMKDVISPFLNTLREITSEMTDFFPEEEEQKQEKEADK